MMQVSIVGCGYTGRALAETWLARGARVQGFGTRPESLRAIAATGAAAAAFDLDRAAAPTDLDGRIVYYAVPPAPVGEGDARLQRFLAAVTGLPRRIVYLSTTGVYGDHAGGRVDEDTPPMPKSPRAVRRLAAETAVRAWAERRAVSWCILRVAGIYGPGRLPLERLRRSEPAIAIAQATPTNRIHRSDLVAACVAAGTSARADRRIVNVTDGTDESQTAYLERVARIAGLPPPPAISRDEAKRAFPETVWSFLGESRRVDNRRLIEELGVALAYPDLDAGIRASLQG